MKYVSQVELRLFYILIGISIYQFSSGYNTFFDVTDLPSLPVWFVLTSLLPLLLFPRSLIFSVLFLFIYCLYEYPVSSAIQGYSTNLVPVYIGYFIVCSGFSDKEISKYSLYAILSSLYVFSGFSKIFLAPELWLSGDVVYSLFNSFNYGVSKTAALSMSLLTIIFELSVIIPLFLPRLRGYFLILIFGFHALNYQLFQINFFYFLLPCLLLCIPWRFPKLV